LTGCGGKKDKEGVARQTAAKVNKEERTVHQINNVLQQQRGLRQEQMDTASRQVLERLIDQELALQKAEDAKIDRDPNVQQQLQAARRDIIARAYVERLGAGVAKPSADQVKQFYDTKPALFKARAVYNLQEILVEATPQQVADLTPRIKAAKSANDIIELLRGAGVKFGANQAVRAAEQLPLASLDAFAAMKEGEVRVDTTPTGMRVVVLAGVRPAPVTLEQATPAIEAYLVNEKKRELVAANLKPLRADAKIEYVGKFKEGVPPATSAADAGSAPGSLVDSTPTAAPAPAPAPAPVAATPPATATPTATAATPAASNGLDNAAITKGLGIK
jgi:EpsD family peptidyl-prolyl cis-trans isomerase